MVILVAYDIADPKRLHKIAKIMQDYGERVQKSIFEVNLTKRSFSSMVRRVKNAIDPEVDGVKFFPLCEECDQRNDIIGVGQYIDFSKNYLVL